MGQDEVIVPDIRTKIACHIEGLGIGFLPKPIAQRYINDGSLIRVHVPGLWREDSPMSLARPKQRVGVIADHLELLFQDSDALIRPFLAAISKSTDTRQDN